MTDNKSGQNWVQFDESTVSEAQKLNQLSNKSELSIDPRGINLDMYSTFARLDKSPEPKGWSDKIQYQGMEQGHTGKSQLILLLDSIQIVNHFHQGKIIAIIHI